jgi:hypothetical protein
MKHMQLSEAIDADLATLAHNSQPAGWRRAEFREVAAYLAPDCPGLIGEVFPDSETRIEVAVDAGVPSRDWLRVATQIARAAAAAAGVEWLDADIFVSLPEPGRCFTKSPGRTALVAHG